MGFFSSSRLYLINSPVVRAENLRFKEEGVRDVLKDVLLPWYNAYRFFIQNVLRLQKVWAWVCTGQSSLGDGTEWSLWVGLRAVWGPLVKVHRAWGLCWAGSAWPLRDAGPPTIEPPLEVYLSHTCPPSWNPDSQVGVGASQPLAVRKRPGKAAAHGAQWCIQVWT